MAHLTTYADYEIPLLLVLSEFPNGQGSSADVLRRFWARFQAVVPPEYTERVRAKGNTDLKWENIVRWARNSLVKRGLMDAPAYGIWRITDAGREYLAQANGSAPSPMTPLREPGPAPSSDRAYTLLIGGRSITLSAEDVLATARREIARGLPSAAHDFQSWVVEVDGHQVGLKWLFGLATGLSHADFKTGEARRALEHLGVTVRRYEDDAEEKKVVAVQDAQKDELTRAEFIGEASTALEHQFADSGQTATLQIVRDQLVQVRFHNFAGCHYELWVHAHSVELGLHFESSQKLNYARLAAFLPHQDALNDALDEQVRIEKWGQGCARVFYEMPKPPLTPALATDHAARLHRLITETLPILREAFAGKVERPRIEARIETPTRAHVIIDSQIATVRDFLNGRTGRPSDERICDWVHLCYEYELYREGRDLFALVDPSQVNPWYYERAKRLAKVCAMKMAGHA